MKNAPPSNAVHALLEVADVVARPEEFLRMIKCQNYSAASFERHVLYNSKFLPLARLQLIP